MFDERKWHEKVTSSTFGGNYLEAANRSIGSFRYVKRMVPVQVPVEYVQLLSEKLPISNLKKKSRREYDVTNSSFDNNFV